MKKENLKKLKFKENIDHEPFFKKWDELIEFLDKEETMKESKKLYLRRFIGRGKDIGKERIESVDIEKETEDHFIINPTTEEMIKKGCSDIYYKEDEYNGIFFSDNLELLKSNKEKALKVRLERIDKEIIILKNRLEREKELKRHILNENTDLVGNVIATVTWNTDK